MWSAWLKVKENGGAAGVDGVTIEQFEERLKDNLYRLWNRMSSGSYFPRAGPRGGDTEDQGGDEGPGRADGGGIMPRRPVVIWVLLLSRMRSIR